MTELEKAAIDYARALHDATHTTGDDPKRADMDLLLHAALSRLTEQAVIFAKRQEENG